MGENNREDKCRGLNVYIISICRKKYRHKPHKFIRVKFKKTFLKLKKI
jgi:hypothetical protein